MRAPLFTQQNRRAYRQHEVAGSLLCTVLFVAGAAPFVQRDWQNPLPLKRAQQQDVVENILVRGIPLPSPDATTVFREPTFSRPQWRTPQQPENRFNGLTLATPPAALPFSPDDWPGGRYVARQQPDTQANLLTGTLAPVVVTPPFAQDEWPNPVRARWSQQVEQQGNLYSLYFPDWYYAQDSSWPNPVRRPWVQQVEPQNTLPLITAPPPPKPFLQAEWLNPRGLRPLQPESGPVSLGIFVTPPPVKPFLKDDWQNPRLAVAYTRLWDDFNLTILLPPGPVPDVVVQHLGPYGYKPKRHKPRDFRDLDRDDLRRAIEVAMGVVAKQPEVAGRVEKIRATFAPADAKAGALDVPRLVRDWRTVGWLLERYQLAQEIERERQRQIEQDDQDAIAILMEIARHA